MRDITLEDTFTSAFTTRSFTTGAPITLAGPPVLSVKEGANDTIITAGVTVDIDTGSTPIVGMHEGTVVATAANGYENGKSYALYIATGTVGGVSVVGEVLENFTVKSSAAAVTIGAAGAGLTAVSLAATGFDAIVATALGMIEIAKAVADRVYTGATHNIQNSLARRVRELSEAFIISSGTCDAAGQTATNVRLESGESSVDQVFRHKRLGIVGGTNVGFDGIASNYDGTLKDLTISPPLPEPCDATSEYEITPAIVHAETVGGGYEGGAVWYDSVNGTPGTEPHVNGTISNPSNSIIDVRTLLDGLGLVLVHSLPGSSAILTQTWNNFEFIGAGYSIDLSDEDVGGCRFFGGSIFGTGTGSSRIVFRECIHLAPLTISMANWIGCNWATTVTLSSAATYNVINCVGQNAVLDFGTAVGNTNVNMNSWSGNIQIEAMGNTGTDTLFADMSGIFTEGTCTGGAVDIHGTFDTVGITNLTLSETRALTAAEVNAEVLDVMNVDTFAEPGQLAPPATASIFTKMNHMYKRWRNLMDNDGTTTQFYADNGTTVDQKQTTSESGGTVTVSEVVSGP